MGVLNTDRLATPGPSAVGYGLAPALVTIHGPRLPHAIFVILSCVANSLRLIGGVGYGSCMAQKSDIPDSIIEIA